MKRQKRLWTAAAVCAVLGATCRAVPGVRFAGLLFWCLTALLIVFALLGQYSERAWAKWGQRVLLVLVCCGFAAFVYLESLVIRDAHTDARAEDAQCVIILGAGVNRCRRPQSFLSLHGAFLIRPPARRASPTFPSARRASPRPLPFPCKFRRSAHSRFQPLQAAARSPQWPLPAPKFPFRRW